MTPFKAESLLLEQGYVKRKGFYCDHVYVKDNRIITFIVASSGFTIGCIKEMNEIDYDTLNYGNKDHCTNLTEAIDRAKLNQIDWEFVHG
jgi:hypothetical protein